MEYFYNPSSHQNLYQVTGKQPFEADEQERNEFISFGNALKVVRKHGQQIRDDAIRKELGIPHTLVEIPLIDVISKRRPENVAVTGMDVNGPHSPYVSQDRKPTENEFNIKRMCNLCTVTVDTFADFLEHLVEKHEAEVENFYVYYFNKDSKYIGRLFIPLDTYCPMCKEIADTTDECLIHHFKIHSFAKRFNCLKDLTVNANHINTDIVSKAEMEWIIVMNGKAYKLTVKPHPPIQGEPEEVEETPKTKSSKKKRR